MPILNGKKVTAFPGLKVKSRNANADAVLMFDNVNTAPTTATGYFYLYVDSGTLKYDNGSSVVSLTGGGGGGVPSWETIYNDDKTLTIDSTTLTFNLTHATNDGLTLSAGAGAAGQVLQFNNSGSGLDVQGSGDTWSVSKAGAVICVGITNTGDMTTTGGAIDWDLIDNNASALSFDAAGKAGIIAIVTTNASEGVTMSGTLGVTGIVTASAGLVSSDGPVAIADNSNAANGLSFVNDTVTTYGNATDAGPIHFGSASLSTGHLLTLSLDESELSGGSYIRCWGQDAGAAHFTVGELGATVIAGSATGTDALTITAGDITLTDGLLTLDTGTLLLTAGDITVTDGSISLTNTADETVVTVVADSVATGIVIDVNADGLTSGTILHLDTSVAALTTGLYIDCYDGAASDFSVAKYGATVIAGNATGTDALTLTNGDITVSSGDITASEGSVVIVNTADEAALSITADSVASNIVVDINADGITDGTILHLDSTVAAMTTGLFIDCFDGAASAFSVGATGITVIAGTAGSAGLTLTAGDAVLADGSLSLTDADEATTLTIVNDTAASVNVIDINADGITDGTVLHIASLAAGMTTGLFIDCFDGAASAFSVGLYGATVIAGTATGTDALTLTKGDITLTNGDVTLTDGDLILAANSSLITFTGTGANGGVITNLKNSATSGLSGTELDVEINIGGTPYYFHVYPTKA
jgi:hypothetical protein